MGVITLLDRIKQTITTKTTIDIIRSYIDWIDIGQLQ